MINTNVKRNPNPNPTPNLDPYPTPHQKPNHNPNSNSLLSEISLQEQLSLEQLSDHRPTTFSNSLKFDNNSGKGGLKVMIVLFYM